MRVPTWYRREHTRGRYNPPAPVVPQGILAKAVEHLKFEGTLGYVIFGRVILDPINEFIVMGSKSGILRFSPVTFQPYFLYAVLIFRHLPDGNILRLTVGTLAKPDISISGCEVTDILSRPFQISLKYQSNIIAIGFQCILENRYRLAGYTDSLPYQVRTIHHVLSIPSSNLCRLSIVILVVNIQSQHGKLDGLYRC